MAGASLAARTPRCLPCSSVFALQLLSNLVQHNFAPLNLVPPCQAMMMILDSPLNKAGKLKVRLKRARGRRGKVLSRRARRWPAPPAALLNPETSHSYSASTPHSAPFSTSNPPRQALYVHTSRNVLIQVNPKIRLPRTFKRFCGLMVQLLQKLSIRATNGPDKLMRVRRAGPGVEGAGSRARCKPGCGWGVRGRTRLRPVRRTRLLLRLTAPPATHSLARAPRPMPLSVTAR